MSLFRLLWPAFFLVCATCAPQTPWPIALPAPETVPVYIIDHGKHAGLAVKYADIPEGFWPESADFARADFLEVGWGEWDYYQAEKPGLWLTLKAALWPTASVLHVVGIPGSLQGSFSGFDIIRLDLHRCAYLRLIGYIHGSFERQGARAVPLGQGDYPDGLFYPAKGRFHLFHTCNGWVAEALEEAGLPMGWLKPVTAAQLMSRVRRLVTSQRTLDGDCIYHVNGIEEGR